MSVSTPLAKIDLTSIETILPKTVRERHCGVEDWFRYIGGGVSFIGASWCYANNLPIPGGLLTFTGVTIVVVHITEKNCGAWARAAKAGERVLQSYKALIQTADQTATKLGVIEEEEKHNQTFLATEEQALLVESTDLELGVKKTQESIAHFQKENQKLQNANLELKATIETQAKLIQSMEHELQTFTTQNNRLQKELQELSQFIVSLKSADKKISELRNATTTQFDKELESFEAKIGQMERVATHVKQIHEENLELHSQIQELQKVKENLEATLKSMNIVQNQNHENSTQLNQLSKKLETNKTELAFTQQQLSVELGEWRKIMTSTKGEKK